MAGADAWEGLTLDPLNLLVGFLFGLIAGKLIFGARIFDGASERVVKQTTVVEGETLPAGERVRVALTWCRDGHGWPRHVAERVAGLCQRLRGHDEPIRVLRQEESTLLHSFTDAEIAVILSFFADEDDRLAALKSLAPLRESDSSESKRIMRYFPSRGAEAGQVLRRGW